MLSVTLVHPAKAVGRNEMPFGRDTDVVPDNIVLDRGPRPPKGRKDLESDCQFAMIPSYQQCCQITVVLVKP